MMHVVCARWKWAQNEDWVEGLAILKEPGLYDIIAFISPDGTSYQGDVWQYHLDFHIGAQSFPLND